MPQPHASRRAHLGHLFALALLSALGDSSFAHGPTRQKVIESIRIDAPANAVWAKLKSFVWRRWPSLIGRARGRSVVNEER